MFTITALEIVTPTEKVFTNTVEAGYCDHFGTDQK